MSDGNGMGCAYGMERWRLTFFLLWVVGIAFGLGSNGTTAAKRSN